MAEVVPMDSPARSAEENVSFDEFVRLFRATMEKTAAEKGYSAVGVDSPNQLFEFVKSVSGDKHAIGEIIYKARRCAAKGDPTDLLKIAA